MSDGWVTALKETIARTETTHKHSSLYSTKEGQTKTDLISSVLGDIKMTELANPIFHPQSINMGPCKGVGAAQTLAP